MWSTVSSRRRGKTRVQRPRLLKGSDVNRLTLDPVYAHSNPIFFEGGLQSTIIIFAKTNTFLPAVRDCGVMRANGGGAVITRARLRAPIAVSARRAAPAQPAMRACRPPPRSLFAAVTIAVSLWHHNHYCTFMFNSPVTKGTPCFLIFFCNNQSLGAW